MIRPQTPKGAATNAAWVTFGTIVGIVISFVTAPVLIYTLGTEKYGLFLIIGSFLGLLSIMNFGLGEATLRYVATYHASRDRAAVNRVFDSTLSFYLVIGSLVLVGVWTGAPVVVEWLSIPADQRESVNSLLRVASLSFAIGLITSPYGVIPSALQRFDIAVKVGTVVMAVRTAGYVALALSGFDLLGLLLCDLAISIVMFITWMSIARRLLPELRLLPSLSFSGLRETAGYSVFSFLTWGLHTAHRESGKLLVGRMLGMAPVAYLGTPDTVAQRLHLVIASGSEALVPRFSVDSKSAESARLFWSSTWSGLAIALTIYIPFCVLIPDFLRLWISPEFASNSGTVGTWLGLYLISQSAFAPVAAYYRGAGKPWFVTLVILGALLITVGSAALLIPAYGVEGAAYAYFAGSISPFLGVLIGSICAFPSRRAFVRALGVPMVMGVFAATLSLGIRRYAGELHWTGLVLFGAAMLLLSGVMIIGGDWLLGGDDSPSKQLIGRVTASRKFKAIAKLVAVRVATETE